ncbi:MAG TPA: hypothetical protein VMA96_11350 [Solirubrobacteraceae bacterium]|nr:hypothetical protein [Solirubrobacteraceae bacterium]
MVMHPYIAKHLVESHVDDLRRAAGGSPLARPADTGAPPRPDARVRLLKFRPFGRAKRTLAQASGPCS